MSGTTEDPHMPLDPTTATIPPPITNTETPSTPSVALPPPKPIGRKLKYEKVLTPPREETNPEPPRTTILSRGNSSLKFELPPKPRPKSQMMNKEEVITKTKPDHKIQKTPTVPLTTPVKRSQSVISLGGHNSKEKNILAQSPSSSFSSSDARAEGLGLSPRNKLTQRSRGSSLRKLMKKKKSDKDPERRSSSLASSPMSSSSRSSLTSSLPTDSPRTKLAKSKRYSSGPVGSGSEDSEDENSTDSQSMSAAEARRKATEVLRNKKMITFRANQSSVTDTGEDYDGKLFSVPDIPRLIQISGDDHPYQLRAATINKIIERLTSYLPEFIEEYFSFLETFFMTYRSFITPMKCLKLLIRRFKESLNEEKEGGDQTEDKEEGEEEGDQTEGQTEEKEEKGEEETEEKDSYEWVSMSDIRKGVCNCIVFWFKEHYRDFSHSANLKKLLDKFIKEAKELNTPENPFILRMEKTVKDKHDKGSYQSFFSLVVDKNVCPPSIVPKNWKNTSFLDLDEEELARQLTMEEFNLYAEIKPEELQDLAWSKPKLKHRSPNLLTMIERFNHVSRGFATLIVSEEKLKNRKKVLEKLILLLDHLHNLQSFNMQMAVMSAFGMASIHRLKHTFGSVKPKLLEVAQKHQEMFNTKSSSKAYRDVIAKVQPPCIPFLGVYLTDLTFIDEGNPEVVDGGLVNFRKKQLEYDVIVQVLKYQTTSYQLNMVPQINTIIANLEELTEDQMYEKSIKSEPRGSKKKDIS